MFAIRMDFDLQRAWSPRTSRERDTFVGPPLSREPSQRL